MGLLSRKHTQTRVAPRCFSGEKPSAARSRIVPAAAGHRTEDGLTESSFFAPSTRQRRYRTKFCRAFMPQA
jgi:hypothetical protein